MDPGDTRLATRRRLVRRSVLAVFLVAVGVGVATGFPTVGLAAVVLVSVALEAGISRFVTRGILRNVHGDDPPEPVRSVVSELSRELGVAVPEVVYGGEGVGILHYRGRTALVVSDSVVGNLDSAALRGVLAHELGHVARDHLRRLPLREATGHVVGVVALWVVFLQGYAWTQATVLVSVYLVTAIFRRNPVYSLAYVGGSLGTVVVPMALDAYASRLEECEADDVAVLATSPTEYFTALYRVSVGEGMPGGVGVRPMDAWRGPLARLTAVYPTIEDRLARHGLDVADVATRVEDSTTGEPATSTD